MAAGGRGRAARSSLGLGPAGQPRQQTVAQRARREEPARPRRDSRAGPPRSSGPPSRLRLPPPRPRGRVRVCAGARPPPGPRSRTPTARPPPTPCLARAAPGLTQAPFPFLLCPRAKPSSGDHGGPPNPHNCSMPLGPACTSGGNGPCCPLRQPRAQGADSGTQRAGRWHYPRAPWGHGEQSLGLAHLHLGTRRHPPQAAPGTEVGKGP